MIFSETKFRAIGSFGGNCGQKTCDPDKWIIQDPKKGPVKNRAKLLERICAPTGLGERPRFAGTVIFSMDQRISINSSPSVHREFGIGFDADLGFVETQILFFLGDTNAHDRLDRAPHH